MEYLIHPEAEKEAEDATTWHGEQDPVVGLEFARTYRAAIDDIAIHPRRYALTEDGPADRECRNVIQLGRFPYRIVYAIVEENILVLAVAHHRRKPDYWVRRLTR